MTPVDLEASLRADEVAPGYLRPRYSDYSFANVPATAAAALGVDLGPTVPSEGVVDVVGVERVVVLVVDGLGWCQWNGCVPDHAFFPRLGSRGLVVPLSSIFPSETAACLTTAHTGEPPVRHGLIGWGVYVETLGTVIEPLPFRTAAGDPLGDRAEGIPDDQLLFDAEPIYPDLQATGVSSVAVQPSETVGSPYSKCVLDRASVVDYASPRALAKAVRDRLEGGVPPQYLHVYYPARPTKPPTGRGPIPRPTVTPARPSPPPLKPNSSTRSIQRWPPRRCCS